MKQLWIGVCLRYMIVSMFLLFSGTVLAENTSTENNTEDSIENIKLAEEPLLDPPTAENVEHRTYELGKILRCPVCQGLSVADSRSDAAVAMKNRIQELVALGYSDEQIVNYFIQRYGEFVLLEPKKDHWFVWVMPGVVVFIGIIVVGGRVFRKSADISATPVDQSVQVEEQTTSDAQNNLYRQKILEELGED